MLSYSVDPVVKYEEPTRLIEKITSVDLAKTETFLADVMLRIGNFLSEEEKDEISNLITETKIKAQEYAGEGNGIMHKSSTIATSGLDWIEIPDYMAEDIAKYKKVMKKIVVLLDVYMAKLPKGNKDPMTLFFRDYFDAMSRGESYMAMNQTDGVCERIITNLLGGFEQRNNGGKYDYNKLRRDLKNFPIIEAASKALAMHRIIDNEDLSIDSMDAKELSNKAKVLKLSKKLLKDIEDMDKFPHEEYVKLEKAHIAQAGQENQFKLGEGRGTQAAYDELLDRVSALEHGWLVRDLPMISQMGNLSRELQNSIDKDNLTNEHKAQIKGFIDYFKKNILKNNKPMSEEKRKELIDGALEKLEEIEEPRIADALNLERENKYADDRTVKQGTKSFAAVVIACAHQIKKTRDRNISLTEEQTMLCADGNLMGLFDRVKNKWNDMPSEPAWHKSIFTKTPENDPFTNMKAKYDSFMQLWRSKITTVMGHPENDPEIVQAATELKAAAKRYIDAKDVQKNLDINATDKKAKRKYNSEKRSDYGKYRYNLAEYLETAAGMVIGLGKNKDLIKIAKPKAEAAQNEAAQAQKKVAKTTEVIEPLKSEQIKPKKKMAGPNMH